MLKVLIQTLILGGIAGASAARAELPADYKVVLLTENFPPFNMAVDDRTSPATMASTASVPTSSGRCSGAPASAIPEPALPLGPPVPVDPGQARLRVVLHDLHPRAGAAVQWVGPLADTSWVLLAPAGSKIAVKNLKDAARYKLGAYKNDAVSQHLEAQGIPVINALRDQENVKKLTGGQIDLWATTDPVGRYLAKQEGVSGLQTVLRFNEAKLYLALNKDTPDEVVERLQRPWSRCARKASSTEAVANHL